MVKFTSNTKNPYAAQTKMEKKEGTKGQFVPKSKAETSYVFRNNTASITGRKVVFKHV